MSVQFPNGDNIEYLIDGQNRRIGKKVNGVIVKKWIYSGQLSPIAELDSTGNVVAQFVGNCMIKNGVTYKLVTDHLGSVRLVLNVATGTIAQKIEYDDNGNVTQNTNPDLQPFAYAGGLYDTQTKLVRFGARDYEATTGRWICKDPIGFEGQQSSLYAYVGNDPINKVDINGLEVEVIFWSPVGYGKSSFGHVSVNISGTTYTFAQSGMKILPTKDYLARNQEFRSGYGYVLNLSDETEKKIEESLRNNKSEYGKLLGLLYSNCGDPIESALENEGFYLGINILPSSLANALKSAGLVGQVKPYFIKYQCE